MMDTGYYFNGSSIYGPSGYTGYRINRRKHIIGHKGDTRHWIYGDHIYSSLEGNTGYWIEKDRICGPSSDLPWEQTMVRRVKRAKKRKAAKIKRDAEGSR
jgi:hypothetical protein